MLQFRNDYTYGAHPQVLDALCATNLEGNVGYGSDVHCENAAARIRALCQAPQADVQFFVGGTQANFIPICAFLRPWEAVIAPVTGHINGHESGAVEATGHKIFAVPTGPDGKLTPSLILPILADCAHLHMAAPKLVYLSDATESGAIYTKAELHALWACCRENHLYLFLDGARLSVAFAAQGNDLTLPDLARYCDAFYIGGTKNGALMGEALVIVTPELQPDFFRVKKQRGAVLAKGWLLGAQFEALFQDGLYWMLGRHAVALAGVLQDGLRALGLHFMVDSPTNQIFPILPNDLLPQLAQICAYEFWCKQDEEHSVIRFVTSFGTTQTDVERLLDAVSKLIYTK